MTTYVVTNIEYDTDGIAVSLPETLIVELDLEPNEVLDDEEVDQLLSDEISNITGFCHTGFEYELQGE